MTLMIHEVQDWMLDLDLSNFKTITFDDGLYSQYKHYNHFLKFNVPLYFFISTDIVCPENEIQNNEIISCEKAHIEYFTNNNKKNYMKWSQIYEIYNTPNCFIGGHSHTHKRTKILPIKEQIFTTKIETEQMMENFNKNGIIIQSFCYPYNEESIGYKNVLKEFNVTDFFGKNRIPIESLKDMK